MGIAHGGQIVCSGVVAELVGDRVRARRPGRASAARRRVGGARVPGRRTRARSLSSRRCSSLDAYRSNLPHELSGFVGRGDDVTAVVKALAREPESCRSSEWAASGKTRLALRVGARSCCPRYADGVWWCELAGVRDPDAVPEAVAAALGYAPSQGVSTGRGPDRGSSATSTCCWCWTTASTSWARWPASCARWASEAPQLSVLATSREALGDTAVSGSYLLPPLELPVDASPFSVEESEAGALFATRAREARGVVRA